MTVLNIGWALARLEDFIEAVEANNSIIPAIPLTSEHHALRRKMAATAVAAEKILDRIVPHWRSEIKTGFTDDQWGQRRELCVRAMEELRMQDAFEENLGENAPVLNAAQLHHWVWDAAKPLWISGHFAEAVRAASIVVNARTQEKLNRRDIAESDLFAQAFTMDAPKRGAPRLRLMDNDGSKTYQSLHQGVAAFARGCYAAIRNPISHDVHGEFNEYEALEKLAAFSILAKWVDGARTEEAEPQVEN
ncbi:TIGR02391 family protein [Nocardia brasiliensis]|uniref:TIGR02391 family protein n=1 Tax=Nocardia brasiliensis TaxID=37326 RepID=UPI002453CB89|nr:TIGR02391 family protein [Nocardia brasiliensis]